MAKLKTKIGKNEFACDGTEEFVKSNYLDFEKKCLETSQQEEEKRNRKYILISAAQSTRRGAIKVLENIYGNGCEKEDTRKRLEWLEDKLTPEQLLVWTEFDLTVAQARRDSFIAECRRMSAQEIEEQLAKDS